MIQRLAISGRRALVGALMMALSWAAALPAAAQESERSINSPEGADAQEDATAREERMLELNEAGFSAFAEERYAEAAQTFEQAHSHVPDPNLRKNAAVAWFMAGDCHRASEAAIYFLLADEMTVKDRIEARSVLGHCRLNEAEQALDAGRADTAAELVQRVSVLETDERVEERLAALRMRVADEAAGPASVSRSHTGWALTGLGAATLIAAGGYHVLSLRRSDRLDALREADAHPARQDQLESSIDTAGWLVPTLYGAGALTTGTGLWLALSQNAEEPTSAPTGSARAPAASVQIGWSVEF